jgi:hypothetical protein
MAAGEEDEARAVAVVGASRVAEVADVVFLAEAEDVAFPVAEAGVASLAEGKATPEEASPAVVAVSPEVEDAVSPAEDKTTQVDEATPAAVAGAPTEAEVVIAAANAANMVGAGVITIGTADTDITGEATTGVVSA